MSDSDNTGAPESGRESLWQRLRARFGRAKDMGSAAVFLSDVNVVVCWLLILWPQWSKDS